MDSFACGFETRGSAPQTVSPRAAHFVSWNVAIFSDVLLMFSPAAFFYVIIYVISLYMIFVVQSSMFQTSSIQSS